MLLAGLYYMCIIYTLLSLQEHRIKLNLFNIYLTAGKHLYLALKKINGKVVLLVISFYVSCNALMIYGVYTRTRIPRYLAKNVMSLNKIEVLFYIGLLFFVVIMIENIMVLPIMLGEGRPYEQSVYIHHRLSRGKKFYLASLIISFEAILIAIMLMLYYAFMFLIAFLVAFSARWTVSTVAFFTIYDRSNMYMMILGAIFSTTANLAFSFMLSLLRNKKERLIILEEGMQQVSVTSWREKLYPRRVMTMIVIGFLVVDATYFIVHKISNDSPALLEGFSETQITAHRGCSLEAPENTLPAIEKAADSGADYAEFDVQLSKDGFVMLMHDATLLRTTGVKNRVGRLSYDQLKELDAGYLFSQKFKGTRIPTLSEVLEACKGKIFLNIEIKVVDEDTEKELVEKVVGLVKDYNYERQCVITSTSLSALERVKKIEPKVKTGYIITFGFSQCVNNKNIDALSMNSQFITDNVIDRAHREGKAVFAWTVNERREINRMLELGVDNIITDRPKYVKHMILSQRGSNNSFKDLVKIILK
ncbi:glycerophosphoryl diester phosphodiesterase [Lachnospiraceae bacterium KM106-2]|nr:glycerophosphoryl diester phosphodiesterase [Lachnospiraceae bacterium KM106-2]